MAENSEIKDTNKNNQSTKKKSTILLAVFLLSLLLLGTYAYYWFQSPSGQRTLIEIKEFIIKYNPISMFQRMLQEAEDVSKNAWDTNINKTSTVKGIIFKSFKPISTTEFAQGAPISLKYDFELKNTVVENLPLTVSCAIKNKDIKSEPGTETGVKIIPSPIITITGNRIYEEIRCVISSEITQKLKGPITFVGKGSFPFKTKDVILPVYFITKETERGLGKESFFSKFNINEKLPIRAVYQGEPLEVGIGVSANDRQPVVIGEGRHPLIGITLKNRWNGKMTELKGLVLSVPKEMTINQGLSQNPNDICPFVLSSTDNKFNRYRIDSNIMNKIKISSGRIMTFECWFDVVDNLVDSSAYYAKKYYKVDAEYNYEFEEKTTTVSIREIKGANENSGVISL